MQNKTLTVTGTGDALFTMKFPEEYYGSMQEISSFIRSCDIRMTNLETNLSDFDLFPSAYSGGTWLNTRGKYLEELERYGFNFYGTANNHAMDYSYAGLLSTIRILEAHHLAHAGTGRDLAEAASPAVLESRGQKVAIFAVDASFKDPSRAGYAAAPFPGRPGVNFLRHRTRYRIDPQDREALQRIAAKTGINFIRQMQIDTGYMMPDRSDVFVLGELEFTTRQDEPVTCCHEKDKARILNAVRQAKKECDYVFIMVHCHDCDNRSNDNPPEYLIEFAHDCIDAGVSAIFGGGCHSLRRVELYHGAPVFYSLGDFIYQGMKVEYQPADFKEKYGLDIHVSTEEALSVRSRGGKVGLHLQEENFRTLLPKLEFRDGKMTGFAMMPVGLNFDRKDDMNGLPVRAEGGEAREIFDIISSLSSPFGIKLKPENGLIVLD